MKKYIQYGSGNISIEKWINYDSSPTLIIQNIPILGTLLKPKLNCEFDKEIKFGDIVKGLPEKKNTIDGIFCSHVLEHLALEDFHIALKNTYDLLKVGGRFRCIVPNLRYFIDQYINTYEIDNKNNLKLEKSACYNFNQNSGYCQHNSRNGFLKRLHQLFSNNSHRWMWDEQSLILALEKYEFKNIKSFQFNDCDDSIFLLPEREYQFSKNAICLESFK